MDKLAREKKQKLLSEVTLNMRLKQTFSKINYLQKGFELYSDDSNNSIVFTFDNEVDPDPDFGGVVLGEILQEGNSIIMTITSLIDSEKMRKETLMENVSDFSFSFFSSSQKKWIANWDEKETWLPVMIKLRINAKNYCYIFNQENPIELS
jgi:hypothetical protein